MTANDITSLNIQISEQDATQEDIDRMTRQLLSELRDQEVESADLAHGGEAPTGTKAVDPVTIGTIAMTVLPAALPKIVDFIQSWAMRGSNRTVKFKGRIGKSDIDFEGSSEDLQKLLAALPGARPK